MERFVVRILFRMALESGGVLNKSDLIYMGLPHNVPFSVIVVGKPLMDTCYADKLHQSKYSSSLHLTVKKIDLPSFPPLTPTVWFVETYHCMLYYCTCRCCCSAVHLDSSLFPLSSTGCDATWQDSAVVITESGSCSM